MTAHSSATGPSLPPALVPVEPDTGVDLPHLSWAPEWHAALGRFATESARMKPVKRISYAPLPPKVKLQVAWSKLRQGREPRGLFTITWHVPVSALRDRGLRAEMLELAEALRRYELPAGEGAILTGMLDARQESALHLVGWLRAALAELSGHAAAAMAPPTAGAVGSDGGDGALELHSDMWVPALLLNVFNHAVPGEGNTTLLPMTQMWGILAEAGMPDDAIAAMKLAKVEAGECDYFNRFNDWLYDHEWTPAVTAALNEAAMEVALGRGQGYFLNDRHWLHGRSPMRSDALPEHLREHRLYRLVFNNARLEAAARTRRVEWELAGLSASGCKA